MKTLAYLLICLSAWAYRYNMAATPQSSLEELKRAFTDREFSINRTVDGHPTKLDISYSIVPIKKDFCHLSLIREIREYESVDTVGKVKITTNITINVHLRDVSSLKFVDRYGSYEGWKKDLSYTNIIAKDRVEFVLKTRKVTKLKSGRIQTLIHNKKSRYTFDFLNKDMGPILTFYEKFYNHLQTCRLGK